MHVQATRNTDTCASSVVGLYNKVVFTTLSIIKNRNTNRKNRLDSRLHNTLVTRIEEAVKPANIKIIQNPRESIKLAYDIVKSAKNEVLKIFPSIKAFRRQTRIGIMHLFKDAIERGVKVRILIPADEQQIIQISNEVSLALPQIDIRSIDESLRTRIGILVVDRKESLIIESKDDTKDNSYAASGLAAYSTSKPITLSYASIFETLWKQAELYEELKIHSRMQKEFIDVAAHELRTPIQPILGLTEILRSKMREDDEEQNKLLDAVIRNAKRLQRLADDILEVTKIESQSLKLSNKQYFNLNDIIINVLAYYQKEENDKKRRKIKLLYYHNYENIYVEADKPRITQVISNLLRNALKFTNDGEICVNVEKDDIAKLILVSIRDTGAGIDPEILSRLFTKFATKSFEGTGLGLYISKSIVEAHGGTIWAENNSNGNGASFSFTLPLSTKI